MLRRNILVKLSSEFVTTSNEKRTKSSLLKIRLTKIHRTQIKKARSRKATTRSHKATRNRKAMTPALAPKIPKLSKILLSQKVEETALTIPTKSLGKNPTAVRVVKNNLAAAQ